MPIRGLNGPSANWNRHRWSEIEAMRRWVRIRQGVPLNGFFPRLHLCGVRFRSHVGSGQHRPVCNDTYVVCKCGEPSELFIFLGKFRRCVCGCATPRAVGAGFEEALRNSFAAVQNLDLYVLAFRHQDTLSLAELARSFAEAARALVGFKRLLAVDDENMLGCFCKGNFDDLISHAGFPFTAQRARPEIVNAIGHRVSLLSRTNIARDVASLSYRVPAVPGDRPCAEAPARREREP